MPQPLQTDPTRRGPSPLDRVNKPWPPRNDRLADDTRPDRGPTAGAPEPAMPTTMDKPIQDVIPDVPSPGNGLGLKTQQTRSDTPPEQAPEAAPTGKGLAPGADRTVSGQLQTLLGAESPYIERARTRAKQYANRRGVMNSSIAAGAGEAAAIDAALPIASQDADTASREFMQGKEHRVQQLMQEKGLTHDEAQREADREQSTQSQERDLRVQQLMQERGLTHDEAQREADREHATKTQATGLRVQQLMQERGLTHDEAQSIADREHATQTQERDLRVQQLMQTRGLTHDEAQREADREQAQELQTQEIGSREYMQDRDLRVQQLMQDRGLDHEAAQREADREHATDLQREDLYVRQLMQGKEIDSREFMQNPRPAGSATHAGSWPVA